MTAGEGFVGDGRSLAKLLLKVIGETAGKLEDGLFGDVVRCERGVATPADFDAGEEIGLGAGQLIETLGAELRLSAEDFGVGREADSCSAAVRRRADFLEFGGSMPSSKGLAVQLFVTRDFDGGFGGKRVDDAYADAMEATGGGIGLALELPARVEGGHDDLKRRLAGVFRMLLDRDAAAIVSDGETISPVQRDLDAAREAGYRFVHRIVDDLGCEVMQSTSVGPPYVHAGATANGFEALENLDRAGVVIV